MIDFSKNVLVLPPGIPVESIQEFVQTIIPADLKTLELLLPPEQSTGYECLTSRKNASGQVKWVASPARNFFSIHHLKWLRRHLRSSAKILLFLRKSPYDDLAGAVLILLIMLISGRAITIIRAATSEPQTVIDVGGGKPPLRWVHKELNLAALGKEYKEIFPTLWEILYFFMFLFLAVKTVVSDKLSSAARRRETSMPFS